MDVQIKEYDMDDSEIIEMATFTKNTTLNAVISAEWENNDGDIDFVDIQLEDGRIINFINKDDIEVIKD